MVRSASDYFQIPVCLHLDHATDFDLIKRAINAGFSSVMYDGSVLDFENNAKNTAQIVQYAHAHGITVEAELGHVGNASVGSISETGTDTDPGESLTIPEEVAKFVSDRHFGIGSDGLILIKPSKVADCYMDMYNADGSISAMCGNGIRCVAKYAYDYGIVNKTSIRIATKSGVKDLDLTVENGKVSAVKVNMGSPILTASMIPVIAETEQVINAPIEVDGETYYMTAVSMGNPHAVTFDLFPEDDSFYRLGPALEHHAAFPAKANIEFCRVRDGGIDVRVWERGDGETLACGTGACATLTAAASLGLCGRESAVRLPGGELFIRWAENNHLYMTGPAETVFEGDWVK
jgi:diaminopimelate epimerase